MKPLSCIKRTVIGVTAILALAACPAAAAQASKELRTLSTHDVMVVYEYQQESIAREVAALYLGVHEELSGKLGLKARFKPTVILAADSEAFRKMAGMDIIVAYALPRQNMMVLDTMRVYVEPFTLKTTLKHELCHLIIHQTARTVDVPRWFDEGVCQWASGGISEIVPGLNDRALERAVVSDRVIGLDFLDTFPMDGKSLALAYEESQSFVEFVVREHGEEGMRGVLASLGDGMGVEEAFISSLGRGRPELEASWREGLRKKYTWALFVSRHVYEILFSLAAVVTLLGFVRLLWRKRRQRLEEDEEEYWE